jgi:hypothetical protein
MATPGKAWVGIDIGKTHHWVCVLNADGAVLLSMKLTNSETEIVSLIATVTELAEQLVWVVDIIGAPSALVLALLPGRASVELPERPVVDRAAICKWRNRFSKYRCDGLLDEPSGYRIGRKWSTLRS